MKIICLLAAHLPVQVERQAGALASTPLIVGGRPWDPGAVLDCSPDAASAGVHLGMRLARAAQVCPGATFVPAREAVYREAHAALEAVLRQRTDRVETAGLGYLFADVSDLRLPTGRDPAQVDVELARSLAREVQQVSPLDARWLAPQRFSGQARATRPRLVSGASNRTVLLSPLPIETLPRSRNLPPPRADDAGYTGDAPRTAIVGRRGCRAVPDLAAGARHVASLPRPGGRTQSPVQRRCAMRAWSRVARLGERRPTWRGQTSGARDNADVRRRDREVAHRQHGH